jgi:RNA polymerase sigma-70 factor (ECF subfamily)
MSQTSSARALKGWMRSKGPAAHLRRSAREPEAFGEFYDFFFTDLLSYLTRRTCDAEAGLDLTAESFAQAYLGRHRFRGSTDREAAAWLYRIAKRQLARYFRRGRAEQVARDRLGLERPELDQESERQIEEFAALDDLRATLRIELSELSPAHREALRLRVVEELPYREVARKLAISEPAARARVSRALRALAGTLDRNRTQLREETVT